MPSTAGAVVIIVAFLLPGFVTVLIQERTHKVSDSPSQIDRTLGIFWYSAWSYVLIAVVAMLLGVHWHDVQHFYHRHDDNPAELIALGAALVLAPSLLIAEATRRWNEGTLRASVLKRLGINPRHPVPTAWDSFFDAGRAYMLRITFSDGHVVMGYYGPDSFSAYAKDGGDLLLEKIYRPDEVGWFGDELPYVGGLWVRASEAVQIEFYDVFDDGQVPEAHAPAQRWWQKGLRRAPAANGPGEEANPTTPTQEGGVAADD